MFHYWIADSTSSSTLRFYSIGLLIAFLEEFITQGVLKGNLVGSIIPTIIAFGPFLIAVRLISKILHKRASQQRALLAHYYSSRKYRSDD